MPTNWKSKNSVQNASLPALSAVLICARLVRKCVSVLNTTGFVQNVMQIMYAQFAGRLLAIPSNIFPVLMSENDSGVVEFA
jgi:hypothetical protein